MANTIRTRTIPEILEFLQYEYSIFRDLPDEIQNRHRRKAQEILHSPETEGVKVSLRVLYLDLAMHDELYRQAKKNKTDVNIILRNKLAIQHMIRYREVQGEIIIPDEKLNQIVLDYQDDLESIPMEMSLLLPESKREHFLSLWIEYDNMAQIIQGVAKLYLVGFKDVNEFRSLAGVLECLVFLSTIVEELQKPIRSL